MLWLIIVKRERDTSRWETGMCERNTTTPGITLSSPHAPGGDLIRPPCMKVKRRNEDVFLKKFLFFP